MKTSDFDYDLPPELIALRPAATRDASRMLVLDRATVTIRHGSVRDLPSYLRAGDLLVMNDTRVIPARLYARKSTGGEVEILLLEETAPGSWDALLRASRRPRPGDRLSLADGRAMATLLEDGELGRVKLAIESSEPFLDLVEKYGETPLPPYIRREGNTAGPDAEDRERYQTVYARAPGAVAAPTAGLHFTAELLRDIESRGVARAMITLHVGLGTFRPVSTERVEEHRMEEERFEIGAGAADAIESARAQGRRILAVGTTTVRTLESAARNGKIRAGVGRTALFIHPPYVFRAVGALLTNFHLPRSTLLMLVSAFAGRENVLRAYEEAVQQRYRFYSYGDCMLIL